MSHPFTVTKKQSANNFTHLISHRSTKPFALEKHGLIFQSAACQHASSERGSSGRCSALPKTEPSVSRVKEASLISKIQSVRFTASVQLLR